ncbi:CPBP family intramembrane glutamic endopeptidase [Acrocarpospora catenulata]|uniref:CPBP family intramembrane glutamic endopeptidase n=1 Tax=Acrocarpospora catenulata TaxID=2836182 RepID=UPI001BD9C9FF|nr:CPBP family intramembrane glutamic endopeptidase [Acrocarpospora catenulata]
MNTTYSVHRQLVVFAVLLTGLVLPALAYAVAQGLDLNHLNDAPVGAQIAVYSQALAPLIAGLGAYLAGGRGLRGFDWGLRRVPWRVIATAWAVPVVGIALGYGTAWLTGLADFAPGNLTDTTGLRPALAVVLGLVPGIIPYILLAFGEQIGWSSFLATRLATTRSTDATALIVGLAWGAFHIPLMLFVPGAVDEGIPVPYALTMFLLQTVTLAFPLVWLRIRTGSIWPVLVLHATVNAAIYFVAGAMTAPTTTGSWFVGEGGALTTAGLLVAVAATRRLWRGR